MSTKKICYDKKNFAERLRYVRESSNKIQQQMADLMGVTLVTYQNYESGKTFPKANDLEKLKEFDINLHWLITGEGQEKLILTYMVAERYMSEEGYTPNFIRMIREVRGNFELQFYILGVYKIIKAKED